MNYWLHRITGGDNAIPLSEELFKKGYISIGWSDFSDEADLNTIRSGWTPFETLFANWNPIPRNRYNLWRFVNEMKPGDIVVVRSHTLLLFVKSPMMLFIPMKQ